MYTNPGREEYRVNQCLPGVMIDTRHGHMELSRWIVVHRVLTMGPSQLSSSSYSPDRLALGHD